MRRSVAFVVAGLACLTPSGGAGAQALTRITGTVTTHPSGGPVAGVVVLPLDARRNAVLTGADGRFELLLESRSSSVVAMRLGFAPETLMARAGEHELTFALRTVPLALARSLVVADAARSTSGLPILRDLDIALRPRESTQDLLRLVPGLVIAQHAGGGKAEQIFLRGFDADHGTDVAITVDGTPVNMVTHAHGQGYADLHFLMPEVVRAIEVRKGPYDARDGDFATAGAVQFRTLDFVDRATLTVRGGSFGARTATAVAPIGRRSSGGYGLVAGSFGMQRGPFVAPQDSRRANLFGKWTTVVDGRPLITTMSHYDARWDASGQIPMRAVDRIGRFGAIDSTEGGATQRSDAAVEWRSAAGRSREWSLRAYATRYAFRLFSNFTLFARDSLDGDGIEQRDDRHVLGSEARVSDVARILGTHGVWRAGAGVRVDRGDVALRTAVDRRATSTVFGGRVRQQHYHAFASERLALGSRAQLELGVRADAFRFNAGSADDAPVAAQWRTVLGPKASLQIDAGAGTTLFASAGRGFHSNDGRSVVAGTRSRDALPRALGGELGIRNSWEGGTVSLTAWGLDLGSELVYVGDEGTTEAGGRTRRTGLDFETRIRLTSWIWLDSDMTLAHGRFRDSPALESRIPLAPSRTATAGLTVRDAGPWTGGVRVRHVGSRPADERGDVTAFGWTLWELFASRSMGRARVFGAVDNLFGIAWNEAQFATTSRLRGEAMPVNELHFTPGAPRAVQLGLEWTWD